MNCIVAVKRLLVRAGIMNAFTSDTQKDAETEDLVVERGRALNALDAQTKTFYAQSADMEQKVEHGQDDLEKVLAHIKAMTNRAADARTILEGMMTKRQNQKQFGHD
jgi:hypothetical protein